MSFFESLDPLSVEDLPVEPAVHTLSMWLSSFKMAEVRVARVKTFKAFALSEVPMPHAFVLSTVWVPHYTLPLAKSFRAHLTEINCARRQYDSLVVGQALQLRQIDFVGLEIYHFISEI